MEKSESRNLVGVLQKSAVVLRVLTESRQPLGPTEIARVTGLDRSTVHRILATLSAERLIERVEGDGTYQLGVALAAMGLIAANRLDLRKVARPHLEKLGALFGETVNLGILDQDAVLYIDMIESSHELRMSATIGARDFLTTTALGKAILAFLPESRVNEILRSIRFEARTPNSIRSVDHLYRSLTEVCSTGYAIDIEENELGACCVGAPIFGFEGDVVGALSLSSPKVRFENHSRERLIDQVLQTARSISKDLGVQRGY